VKGVGAPRGAGHLDRLTPAVLELPLDPLEFWGVLTLTEGEKWTSLPSS